MAERSVGRFLRCGLLEHGFARFQCGACGDELLLAFSCRQRGLCTSCGAKRSAAWGRWVREELVRPVAHRHLVFTIPKRLRPFFKFNRDLLRQMSGWAYGLVRTLLAAQVPPQESEEPGSARQESEEPGSARPGCVSVLSLAGNLLNVHPHVHMIVSDGAFSQSGERFVSADPELWKHLEEAFRHKVLNELRKRGHISPEVQESMLFWTHSGFSVFVGAPISPDDPERLERLGRYLRRPHLAESRVRYDEESDKVIYSSGKLPHPKYKANFRIFPAREFVAAVCGLLPDPKRHESLAYGEYANVVRGKRAKQGPQAPLSEEKPLPLRLKALWRELLKHIYEVDPLLCPCGGKLKRIALILDPAVIQKILRHLKRWPPPRRPPKRPRDPPPAPPRDAQHQEPPLSEAEGSQLPLWEDDDEIWSQLPAHEEG